MVWLFCAIAVLAVALALFAWREWIAPWRQIEELVRQIGRRERPRTFLVSGGKRAQRIALALENLLTQQQEQARQIGERTSGDEAIFSAMQDGLLVLDGERRIALANRTFQELFGVRENSLGQPLLEVIRDVNVAEAISETFRNRQPVRREIAVSERLLQMDSVPMGNENGKMAGVVILFHDISELKRADQIRRDFVANVSHELRTPLSILRGYIETLLDHPKTSDEESARILHVMDRHSKRLGLLVEDLLELARLESPNPNLQWSDVNLSDLFREVIHDWEDKFKDKKLKVVVDLAPDLPAIRADPARLQEILYNLLDNAVNYSHENGEIRLQAGRRGAEIVLAVTDNGIGISKEDLSRIFERFYRADKARSREAGGTGLGLSIVKHIVQLHGGRVEAESELGKGTTIRAVLPLVTQT
jgi:two-component system phosphate regulon sensor histidine kinase PhoR